MVADGATNSLIGVLAGGITGALITAFLLRKLRQNRRRSRR